MEQNKNPDFLRDALNGLSAEATLTETVDCGAESAWDGVV